MSLSPYGLGLTFLCRVVLTSLLTTSNVVYVSRTDTLTPPQEEHTMTTSSRVPGVTRNSAWKAAVAAVQAQHTTTSARPAVSR